MTFIRHSTLRAAGAASIAAFLVSGSVFAATPGFSDQTASAGLSFSHTAAGDIDMGGEMHGGGTVGDFNGDGWPDLFAPGGGNAGDALFINNGDGTFTDTSAISGIDIDAPAMMATFGDIDADGDVDLFHTSPGSFFTGILRPQKLYENDGSGHFTDISASAGIDTSKGACVAGFTDVNADNRADIMVGNCNALDVSSGTPFPVPGEWELWLNQGNNTFVDVADAAGLNVRPGFPMSLTLGDPDLDGDLDLFATGMGPNNPFSPGLLGEQVLFTNQGVAGYADHTHARGLGNMEWGWGASFADFDNDGDEELASAGSVATDIGFVFLGELGNPGRVYDNDGSGQLSPALNFGLQNQYTSGLAVGDFDNDGFSDLVIVKTAFDITTPDGPMVGDGRPLLLRNAGNANRSVSIRLQGVQSNRMGIGAKVILRTPDGRQVREVAAGSSFASNNSPWVNFGMGSAYRGRVIVKWPSGLIEAFQITASKNLLTLEEGTGFAL